MDRKTLQGSLILLALLVPSAHAEIHQWQDEDGGTHFGDRPPEDVETRVLSAPRQQHLERLTLTWAREDITLSEEARQRVEQGLRRMVMQYTRALGLDLHDTVAVNISLLETRQDLVAWTRERLGHSPGRYLGIYLHDTNEVAAWDHGPEDKVVNTLLHEGGHVILGQLTGRPPIWLNEGLAQYFETIRPTGDGVEVHPVPEAALLIRQWVEDKKLITLRDYLSIPEKRWRELAHERNAIPYTLAWGLVYFLMSDDSGRRVLRQLLMDLEKSGRPATMQRLVDIYPGGLSRLEYEFFRWAQGDMAPHRYD